VSGVLFSVGVCVCHLLICLHRSRTKVVAEAEKVKTVDGGLGAYSHFPFHTFHLGFYTILPPPILCGVLHTRGGGSGGGRILRNGRAIVLQ